MKKKLLIFCLGMLLLTNLIGQSYDPSYREVVDSIMTPVDFVQAGMMPNDKMLLPKPTSLPKNQLIDIWRQQKHLCKLPLDDGRK